MMNSTGSQMYQVSLIVNGNPETLTVSPSKTLLELLREDLFLTGTKCGCDDSNCGACTILLDGKAIKSCCMLAMQADGKSVTTIEGLETNEGMHPLQKAFIEQFAIQCGYCTPGMILTAKAILDENPEANEEEIREGLHGNVCRCTGYKNIVKAVLAVQRGDYR